MAVRHSEGPTDPEKESPMTVVTDCACDFNRSNENGCGVPSGASPGHAAAPAGPATASASNVAIAPRRPSSADNGWVAKGVSTMDPWRMAAG